jgi:hypothetical protein
MGNCSSNNVSGLKIPHQPLNANNSLAETGNITPMPTHAAGPTAVPASAGLDSMGSMPDTSQVGFIPGATSPFATNRPF